MLLPLVFLMASLLAGRRSQNASGFSNFKNSLQAKLFVLLLSLILLLYYYKNYQCISTGFSQLKLIIILRCVLRHKIIQSPFFPCQSLLSLAISNLYNFSSLCFISLKYQCSRYFSETFHMEDLPSYCNL